MIKPGMISAAALAFLSRTCQIGPLDPPAASPACRVPLAQAQLLSTESRAAWPGRDRDRRRQPQHDAAHAAMESGSH